MGGHGVGWQEMPRYQFKVRNIIQNCMNNI